MMLLAVLTLTFLHLAFRSVDVRSTRPLADSLGWLTVAGLCAIALMVGVVLSIVISFRRHSWWPALLSLVIVTVTGLAGVLVTYMGVNWVIDEAERAFIEDPAAVANSIRELGEFVGLDTSTIDDLIRDMRSQLGV